MTKKKLMRENFLFFHTVDIVHSQHSVVMLEIYPHFKNFREINFAESRVCTVEKREILSHRKKFRQINSLVTYLVKLLLSQNFCQKCMRENSRNFHTVSSMLIVWKLQKFSLTHFYQKFRESNSFTK